MRKLSPRRATAGPAMDTERRNEQEVEEEAEAEGQVLDEPFWVPDQQSEACILCSSQFNVLRRRHHCRRCGNVLCHSCSSHKAVISGGSTSPVRVCNTCIKVVDFENNKTPSDHFARIHAAKRQRSQSVLAKLDILQTPIPSVSSHRLHSSAGSVIEEVSFLSGVLKKAGGKECLWRQRFFKLTPFFLIYYAVTQDGDYNNANPLNRMSLSDISRVFVHTDETQSFTFTVESGRSGGVYAPFLLSAASKREMMRWMIMIAALTKAMNQSLVLSDQFKHAALPLLFAEQMGGILTCKYTVDGRSACPIVSKWRYFPSGALLKSIGSSSYKWDGCSLSSSGSWDGVTLLWKSYHYVYVPPQRKYISESEDQSIYSWKNHTLSSDTNDIQITVEGDIPHMLALFCGLIEQESNRTTHD